MAVFNFEDMFGSVGDIPNVQDTIENMSVEVLEESKEPRVIQAEHPIVVLCLDCSYSMSTKDSSEGVSRIELVKRYAKEFINNNLVQGIDKEKIELCVITFDSNVKILKDFAPVSEISDDFSMLKATGLTSLYSALIIAVSSARKRRDALLADGISCFKPIIFVVTDGKPEGEDDMREPCRKILAKYVDKGEDGKAKMRLIICGMDRCDMQEMNALCQDKQLIGLRDTDALQEAFKLFTASIASVSSSVVSDDVILAFDKAKDKLAVPKGQRMELELN